MKKILNRLNSRCGETLLETLVATLIFTFGSIIMLSMITSAARINDAAKRADEKYYTDMIFVEKAIYNDGTTPTMSVSFSFNGTLTDSANVYKAVNPTEEGLYAYYPLHPTEGDDIS